MADRLAAQGLAHEKVLADRLAAQGAAHEKDLAEKVAQVRAAVMQELLESYGIKGKEEALVGEKRRADGASSSSLLRTKKARKVT